MLCEHLGDATGMVKALCNPDVFAMVNRCQLHGRCLPTFQPGPRKAAWKSRDEARLYTLCGECADRMPRRQ